MPTKKTLSLTTRLTIWYTLSSVGVVLTATVYLYWSFVHALDYRDKKFFSSKLEAIRSLLNRNDNGQALRFRIEKEWPARTSEIFYVRLFDPEGKMIAHAPEGTHIFDKLEARIDHSAEPFAKEVRELVRFEDQIFRALTSPLDYENKQYVVQIALDRSEEGALLNEYRQRLLIVLAVCFVPCALVCFQIARRGLRPVREMAKTAARIGSSNLDEKILLRPMPSELAHLASTFDAMLDRLKASFERLQRFSADIAHELRTPINNISGELQVALGKDRSAEYYKDAIGSSLEECHRISRIIDSLLFLARAENPRIELSKEPINLRNELETALEFYEPAATEAGITCSLEVEGELTILAERTLFQRALGNIISNAIKKTPPSGRIQVTASRTESNVQIEVTDSGVGIPPEHLPYLFDRFYRVDASRSKDSGGSGLGLAIVKSIASIHGGAVSISSEVGAGTHVRLSLPSDASGSAHQA